MRVIIVSCIIILFTSNSFAAIYQTIDEDGNIVFTDKPDPNSVEKKLISPSVVTIKKSKSKEEKKPVGGLGELKVEEKKAVAYKKIVIIAPEDDLAVRNNAGNIELKLQIIPDLQTKFDHHIKVEFDGKKHKSSWKSSSILFTNVDRGTHTLKAYIVDKSGKRLKSSKLVTFHLQRFSRRF